MSIMRQLVLSLWFFEASSKSITTSDKFLQIAISLLK